MQGFGRGSLGGNKFLWGQGGIKFSEYHTDESESAQNGDVKEELALACTMIARNPIVVLHRKYGESVFLFIVICRNIVYNRIVR